MLVAASDGRARNLESPMNGRAHWSAAALGAITTCCVALAGCAGARHAKPDEPVPIEATAAIEAAEPPAPAAPEAAPEAVTPPQPNVIPPAAVVAPRARETVIPPAVSQPVRPESPVATAPPAVPRTTTVPPPAVPKATTAPPPQVVPKATPAPAPVASPPVPAPLDLESLGTRLKQTRAIGVLTKLSLKNQVDDLLQKFRAYHRQQGTATLPELRRSYDMLMLKVLSLLQDSDPPLARDIVQSRAAIWGILADPRKFNEASLMAGATT